MKTILALSGTPKRGGPTDMLLDAASGGARSEGAVVEKVILNDLVFRPCQDCGGCDATGICVLHDDMTALYERLLKADGLIVASPIYFGSISAQLKMMIDRLQSQWVAKFILKKVESRKRQGVFLSVGGQDRRDYFESAAKLVKILLATLGVIYIGDYFFSGYNERSHDEAAAAAALEKARSLGALLVPSA